MTASARGWWWGKINIHILYFSFSRSALASLTNVFGKNEKKNKTSVYRLRHPRTSSYKNAVWTYNKGTPRCTGKGFRRRWWLCSLTVTEVVTYHIDNICKGLSQIQFLSNPLCFDLSDKLSGHLRIWPDKTYFWPDIVRWPAVICSPDLNLQLYHSRS